MDICINHNTYISRLTKEYLCNSEGHTPVSCSHPIHRVSTSRMDDVYGKTRNNLASCSERKRLWNPWKEICSLLSALLPRGRKKPPGDLRFPSNLRQRPNFQ